MCVSYQENAVWRFIRFALHTHTWQVLCLNLSRKSIDITVTPGSRFYVLWNGFMFITILITVWIYCYLAAFTRFKPSISYKNHRVGFACTYLIDFLFIADMLVSMKVAYEGANGKIIIEYL